MTKRQAPTPKFLEQQQKMLEEERAAQVTLAERLLDEISQLNDDSGIIDSTGDDGFGEGAATSVDQDRDRALHSQAMARIDEIDAALARIADDSYGNCEICGEQIAKARLEALPTATQCVNCKAGGLASRHRGGLGRRSAA